MKVLCNKLRFLSSWGPSSYKQHIIKNNLIEDFQVWFTKFDLNISVTPMFIFEFYKYEYLAKFANAIRNKPFVEFLERFLIKRLLYLIAYLPINEFFNMLEILNIMAEMGIISRYHFYLRSLTERFKGNTSL